MSSSSFLQGQLELCYGLDFAYAVPASPQQVGGEKEMREPAGERSW